MPKVTIYIRKEDEPKWKAIKNRADWLSVVITMFATEPLVQQLAEIIKETSNFKYLENHPEKRKELMGLNFLVNETNSSYKNLKRAKK